MTDFDFNTQTLEHLKQAILDKIERKYPVNNRMLTFISTTKQKNYQSLGEFLQASHHQARESGLHSGDWSKLRH